MLAETNDFYNFIETNYESLKEKDYITAQEGFRRWKEYKAFADGAGLEFLDAAEYAQAADEDGIHMTAESHIRLGEAMAEKVRELLG